MLFRYIEVSASTISGRPASSQQLRNFPRFRLLSIIATPARPSAKHNRRVEHAGQAQRSDGIFCSNDSSTLGMVLALKQNNLAGSKKLVGFDTSPGLVEA